MSSGVAVAAVLAVVAPAQAHLVEDEPGVVAVDTPSRWLVTAAEVRAAARADLRAAARVAERVAARAQARREARAPEPVEVQDPTPLTVEPVHTRSRIRMVQANIKSSLSAAQFASDLSLVMATRPDFVTLNEAPRRSAEQITLPGYAFYRGTDSSATMETPVLWRTDRWEPVATGTRYLSMRRVKWGVRAVNWVQVRHHRTGRLVSVISAHPAPTIKRTAGLLPQFMSGLADLVHELDGAGPVFVGGDLNAHYGGSLYPGAAIAGANMAATFDVFGKPSGGTGDYGGATIDYLLFQPLAGVEVTAQSTIELASDHDAVVGWFRYSW